MGRHAFSHDSTSASHYQRHCYIFGVGSENISSFIQTWAEKEHYSTLWEKPTSRATNCWRWETVQINNNKRNGKKRKERNGLSCLVYVKKDHKCHYTDARHVDDERRTYYYNASTKRGKQKRINKEAEAGRVDVVFVIINFPALVVA